VLVLLGALFCLADAALLAVRLTWEPARIAAGGAGLARISLARFGEHVESVGARDAGGRAVPVSLSAGVIRPEVQLRPGTRIHLTATVRRSHWLGWLLGRTETVETTARTPASFLKSTMVYPKVGAPVAVRFSSPVRVVFVRHPDGTRKTLTMRRARRVVPIGVLAGGEHLAGTVLVTGVPRRWERLPQPVRVNWFPAGPAAHVLVRPALNSQLAPSAPIILTFSRPVADILGDARPVFKPPVTGAWRRPNDHTLVFQPSGLGFPLGRRVHLRLPVAMDVISGSDPARSKALTWQVPRGSLVRFKQLLAETGYLPFDFRPTVEVPLTAVGQMRAAIEPPEGTFEWRYPKTPWKLRALWGKEADRATMVRGAIMAYQSTHAMDPNGFPSMTVFRSLVRDVLAGRHAKGGYSYVFVTESSPEMLTLWHNGKVVLRTPVNTGISGRPTDLGTFPVYLHLESTTMEGTNPDGSHYRDVGVPWVNYFSGGDAIHGFIRPGYGWPQSLGCVEVQPSTAEVIFPYVKVGTLVTVQA
jgi:hypothetical protein